MISCGSFHFRVKPGKAQNEHMLSGLPPIATDVRRSAIGSFVPKATVGIGRKPVSVNPLQAQLSSRTSPSKLLRDSGREALTHTTVMRAPAFVSSRGPVLPPLVLRTIAYGEEPCALSQEPIGLDALLGPTKSSA